MCVSYRHTWRRKMFVPVCGSRRFSKGRETISKWQPSERTCRRAQIKGTRWTQIYWIQKDTDAICPSISYVKWWYNLDRWSMNSSDGGQTPNGKFRKDLTNLDLDNFCLDADLNCFENHCQSLVEICFEFICRFLEDDFETYVVQMRQPHIWGGEPELLMSSHVLR